MNSCNREGKLDFAEIKRNLDPGFSYIIFEKVSISKWRRAEGPRA